jgi:hypothetical protein
VEATGSQVLTNTPLDFPEAPRGGLPEREDDGVPVDGGREVSERSMDPGGETDVVAGERVNRSAPAEAPRQRESSPLPGWAVEILGLTLKGFVLLAALLAFLNINESALDRVLRNYTGSSIAVGVALAAGVVLATLAPQLRPGRPRILLTATAALLVTLALLAALVLGVASKDTTDRPQVSAELTDADGQLTVAFSATAGGLRRTEVLTVEVEGLSAYRPVYRQVTGQLGSRPFSQELPPVKDEPADPTEEFVSRLNYRFVGGDTSGVASVEDTVALPPGVYERVRVTASVITSSETPGSSGLVRCDRRAERRSCVALALPPPVLTPTLTTTSVDGRTESVSAAATGLRTTQRLALEIFEIPSGAPARLVAALDSAPDSSGNAAATLPVPTSTAGVSICVSAGIQERLFPVPQAPPGDLDDGADSTAPPASSAPPADASGTMTGTSAGDGGSLGAPRLPCESGPTTAILRLNP